MVKTVLRCRNHDALRSPDKNAVSFTDLETGKNIKCNHLGYIVTNTFSEYSVFAVQL